MIYYGKLYQHYKGDFYIPVFLARDSCNAREKNPKTLLVIYYSLSKSCYRARPLDEFTEEVLWPHGIMKPRFRLVADPTT